MNKKNNLPEISKIKILILVGGLGTRLKSVINNIPKPMAPIEGKPFLYYLLTQIKKAGIVNIVFCSGYLHEKIEDFFGDGKKFGLNIEYCVEKEPLGTAGAIKNAEDLINGPFFMMNGDVYVEMNFVKLLSIFKTNTAKYVMLLTKLRANSPGGVVIVDKNMKIVEFLEKPSISIIENLKSPYLNAGLYLLSPEILNLIPKNKKFSLEKEIFPNLIGPKKFFFALIDDGYWIDIGIPDNYHQFIQDVKENKIKI